jgi:hypothetical protein
MQEIYAAKCSWQEETYFQFAGGNTCSRTMQRFMLLCRSPVITAAAAACCRFGSSIPASFFVSFSAPVLVTFRVDGTASVGSEVFDHIRTSLGRKRRCALGLETALGEEDDFPPDVGGEAAAVDDGGGSDATWDEVVGAAGSGAPCGADGGGAYGYGNAGYAAAYGWGIPG